MSAMPLGVAPPITKMSARASNLCRQRPTGSLFQCLLGAFRLQAAARSQPDGRRALYRSPAPAGQSRPHACHFRRQKSASAISGGRRCDLCQRSDPGSYCRISVHYQETQEFIENVYIPDLLAVASFYKDWGAIGGTTNFLAWGEFPETDKEPESLYMPRGVIMNAQSGWCENGSSSQGNRRRNARLV